MILTGVIINFAAIILGSAAGLLGIGSFLLGAVVSPLTGIYGTSIYPMAVILIISGMLSLIALHHIPNLKR